MQIALSSWHCDILNYSLTPSNYGPNGKWKWSVNEESLNFGRLREYWELLGAVARGEQPALKLPTVTDKTDKDERRQNSQREEFDDDIPF